MIKNNGIALNLAIPLFSLRRHGKNVFEAGLEGSNLFLEVIEAIAGHGDFLDSRVTVFVVDDVFENCLGLVARFRDLLHLAEDALRQVFLRVGRDAAGFRIEFYVGDQRVRLYQGVGELMLRGDDIEFVDGFHDSLLFYSV